MLRFDAYSNCISSYMPIAIDLTFPDIALPVKLNVAPIASFN
ncbi:hypothetical protein THZB04_40088 [Vibrio owensii]|nr:hypothetical protein THZB04_40088 [Vibrio owensii]